MNKFLLKINPNQYVNGLITVLIIAIISLLLSSYYSTPKLLFAILIGMSVSHLSFKKSFKKGIQFTSDPILKLGVSLLGFRLSFDKITELGGVSLIVILFLILLTILFGYFFSIILLKNKNFGLLSAGSVAICGASAAIAVFSILPKDKIGNKDLSLVIITVTLLSTIAMVMYPIIFDLIGANENQKGFLIGSTIHDVAQVIGAGYSASEQTGIVATFVKMIRVSILPFLILFLLFFSRNKNENSFSIPWFLSLFFIFCLLNNLLDFPDYLISLINNFSSFCILLAISAIGVKTNFSFIFEVSFKYFILIFLETIFLLITSIVIIKTGIITG
ncbi:MAG: YeiH family protein [Paracoccaceae bacterium]